VVIEEPGELPERFEILGDPLVDIGTLNFDRHETPVAERRTPSSASTMRSTSAKENGQPYPRPLLEDRRARRGVSAGVRRRWRSG